MIITGIARIGRDAEVRFTQSGDPVASLSLAFNYGQKGQDGNRPSQWIDASLWGKRAESLASFLAKGTMVSVVLSEPHIETYQGKNGEGHKLVARVLDIEFAGGKREERTDEPRQASPSPRGSGASGFDDMDDDIPF